jgi:ArsR family transcriptional regulator
MNSFLVDYFVKWRNIIIWKRVMKSHLRVLKALSDKNRLRIMKMLEARPMCVCEITDVLKLAPSTVSKHLSLLHEAELIEDSKEGRWVNYSLPSESLIPFVSEMLQLLRRSLKDDPEVLADTEKAKKVNRAELCK